ncbi:MAG: penicillin-binding protein 2 [bacterium]|nr:penicillin-binding protein 2 [bacterium]
MKSNPRWRLITIVAFFLLFSLIIAGNLYKVQVYSHDAYTRIADKQYSNGEGDIFDRGQIYFTSKDGNKVSFAGVKEGYIVVAEINKIIDVEDTFSKISAVIPLDKDDFLNKLNKKSVTSVELARHIEIDKGDEIKAKKIPGIRLAKERWRFYPGNEQASHVIGYFGYGKDSTLSGQYGLENFYENVLTRKDENLYGNFIADLFINFKKTVVDGEDLSGDVVAGIEPTVENELEINLNKIQKAWNPELVGGIIMDPKDGKVLAMASLPSFNPNSYGSAKNGRVYANPLVQGRYELGSIMKPLTMAAGLDSGAITAKSTYKDTGSITLNGRTIRNHDGKVHGVTSMQEILSQSLNLGASYVALKMDVDSDKSFGAYMERFGLGTSTGIDLPYELNGDIRNVKSKREVERATASFGQGIAVTPIEMVRALASLANGGYLITPHVADSLEYRLGTSKVVDGGEPVRILKKETTDDVTKMLVKVVDEVLKNGTVKMDRWSIAAKTGTAQIADPVNGGYYKDRFLHSFFGYFPANDPKFVVFLYQLYPKGAQYASETLTDPFIDLTKFLLNYYEVPPDR